jgi:hypothetical protein
MSNIGRGKLMKVEVVGTEDGPRTEVVILGYSALCGAAGSMIGGEVIVGPNAGAEQPKTNANGVWAAAVWCMENGIEPAGVSVHDGQASVMIMQEQFMSFVDGDEDLDSSQVRFLKAVYAIDLPNGLRLHTNTSGDTFVRWLAGVEKGDENLSILVEVEGVEKKTWHGDLRQLFERVNHEELGVPIDIVRLIGEWVRRQAIPPIHDGVYAQWPIPSLQEGLYVKNVVVTFRPLELKS